MMAKKKTKIKQLVETITHHGITLQIQRNGFHSIVEYFTTGDTTPFDVAEEISEETVDRIITGLYQQ